MSDVRSAFVASPGIVKIIDKIEIRRGDTHRRCPQNILVTGRAGSGKTTLIEHLKKRYPRRTSENNDKDIVPVVSMLFPKGGSQRQMACELLKQLGDPDYQERDADGAYSKLWELLKKCEVEIICLDELHNMKHGMSGRVCPLATAFIKALLTEPKILIVGFGTEEVEKLIKTEGELATRFPHTYSMPKYSIYDRGRPTFWTYLKKLSKYLEVKNPELIYEGDFPEKLYFATRALPRTMGQLIHCAIMEASIAGRSEIIDADFEEAALDLWPCREQAKVFRLRSDKVQELVSKRAYTQPDDNRSLEILTEIFSQKGVFTDMVYQADKAVLADK